MAGTLNRTMIDCPLFAPAFYLFFSACPPVFYLPFGLLPSHFICLTGLLPSQSISLSGLLPNHFICFRLHEFQDLKKSCRLLTLYILIDGRVHIIVFHNACQEQLALLVV